MSNLSLRFECSGLVTVFFCWLLTKLVRPSREKTHLVLRFARLVGWIAAGLGGRTHVGSFEVAARLTLASVHLLIIIARFMGDDDDFDTWRYT